MLNARHCSAFVTSNENFQKSFTLPTTCVLCISFQSATQYPLEYSLRPLVEIEIERPSGISNLYVFSHLINIKFCKPEDSLSHIYQDSIDLNFKHLVINTKSFISISGFKVILLACPRSLLSSSKQLSEDWASRRHRSFYTDLNVLLRRVHKYALFTPYIVIILLILQRTIQC